MVKSDLETRVNKNLFSNHYLDNLIQKNPEWKKRDHERAFQMIKDIYIEEKSFVKGLNEPQLEERFFQKIFKIFLPDFEVQAPTEEEDFPDYAFFPNRQVLDKAHENKGTRSFYVNAFAIGEVKKWGVELDRFGRDKYNKRRNPSFQIWLYLNETEPKWGILSNGRKWRLYHEDKPLDCYYEIDLVTLLENDDIEGFKYFYYFFMKEALIPSKDGVVFIETVLGESLSYAKEIGENLKENVYKAMEKIVEGFFNWPQNELDPEDERIRLEVQKSAMRLLYRFLFLLYAEGKGLLNLKDEQYRTMYSFDRLKKEIREKKEGPDQEYYSPIATTLWSRLKDLFRLIDQGSEVLDIPKDQFYVPPYNGGLFDPKRNPRLEELIIGDTHLADAIDLLARSSGEGDMKGFVDYSTLEIRHLGSIYEGLLEYKLKLAEKDMVVKGGKKKRIWVTLEEFNKKRKHVKSFEDFDEFDRVQTGELYLTTDKGERKATGSYYTPDYIVNYIVKNTINPVVEQKWKEASKKGQSLIDATLSVKVLDPAMGSGHFLVGAVELLAGKLLEAVKKDIEAEIVKDDRHFTPDWAKREVVANCIYGVDLNDLAVELAKLSLWLTTISKDKPLSFLDHRLKQGNSLIGTNLKDLPWHPLKKRDRKQRRMDIPEGFIKKLVDTTRQISSIDDDTLTNIIKKEEMFENFKTTIEYDMIKTIADVRTSIHFGNEIDEDTYGKFTGKAYHCSHSEWNSMKDESFVKNSKEIAEERKFFHWELEFPEVFFEDGTLRENPGFDVVVGNPPYGDILNKSDKDYIKNSGSIFYGGRGEIFPLFIEKYTLAKKQARLGFIVPNSALGGKHFELFRKNASEKLKIQSIIDFRNTPIFDVEAKVMIIIISKKYMKNSYDTSYYWEKIQGFSFKNRDIIRIEPGSMNKWFPQYPLVSKIIDIELTTDLEPNIGTCHDAGLDYKHKNVGWKQRGKKLSVGKLITYYGKKRNSKDYPLLKGEHINKYSIQESNFWLIHNYLDYLTPDRTILVYHDLLNVPLKILTRQTSDKIIATIDINQNYTAKSIHTTLVKKKNYSQFYVLTLLNSKLISYIYRKMSFEEGRVFAQVRLFNLRKLPIRLISFTTPKDEKKKFVKKLISDYKKLDFWNIIVNINRCLPKDKHGNFKTEEEKSDVVHDFLAYLAEQMIEMNKEKNREIKGFLEWLESLIEVKIDNLTNKTKLMKYYDFDFQEVFNILKKNKNKIFINLLDREFHENLKREFEKSMAILSPLRNKIEATDSLIDQIVYKLYGLTEDEIRIVEESLE